MIQLPVVSLCTTLVQINIKNHNSECNYSKHGYDNLVYGIHGIISENSSMSHNTKYIHIIKHCIKGNMHNITAPEGAIYNVEIEIRALHSKTYPHSVMDFLAIQLLDLHKR